MFRYAFWLLIFFFPLISQGKIYVDIGSAKVKKSVLAVSPFTFRGIQETGNQLIGKELYIRLNNNLKFSGYFTILSPRAFIEDPSKKSPIPYPQDSQGFRWENWKLSGADLLLFSSYSVEKNNLNFNVSLYDVNLRKSYFRKDYSAPLNYKEKLIDRLSNDIVRRLTGREGVFLTKIVSVRSMEGSKKELFIMDWNGKNKERLTHHHSIVLSPLWSPRGSHVAYTAFVFNKRLKKRLTALFLLHRATKTIQILSNKKGANLGADFMPNGREMLITLTHGPGFMNIFKFHLQTKKLIPLTQGPWRAINVEPSIHHRTQRIAFSSDRTGRTMIYTMNKKGKDIQQLTYAGHHNATPDWSPVKKQLVFSGQSRGRFDIFLINENGTGLKRLTTLKKKNGRWANFESPSFSPDGQFLVFSSDFSGNYQLYIMNLDDYFIERITFDSHNYKSPRWSPYLTGPEEITTY